VAVTESDLLAALEAALRRGGGGDNDEGWVTARELIARTGLSERTVNRGLHTLYDAERLETLRVWRRNIAGDMQRVPGYRLRTTNGGNDHG
jgi:hypothetical protein